MGRLALLLIAAAVAGWGQSIVGSGEPTPRVALRDGCLIMLVGMVIFALSARPPLSPPSIPPGRRDALPRNRQLALVIGLFLALVMGVAFALSARLVVESTVAGLVLWLVGLVVAGAAVLWPQRSAPVAEGQGWSVEEARRYLAGYRSERPAAQGRRMVWDLVLAGGLVALVLLLHLWPFADLPSGCLGGECAEGMRTLTILESGDPELLLLDPAPPYILLVALFFGLFSPSLQALQTAGLLIGLALLPLFYWAAARIARPGVALVGTLLLVVSPLYTPLTRAPSAGFFLLAPLLLYLGTRLRGEQTPGSPRIWSLAGIAAGLLLWMVPLSGLSLLLVWYLLTPPASRRRHPLVFWLFVLAIGLPRFILALGSAAALLPALPDLDALAPAQWLSAPAGLRGVAGLLVYLGLAYLLRHFVWGPGRLLLLGLPTLAWLLSPGAGMGPFPFVPLAAPLLLVAVVGLDRIAGEVIRVWQPLVSPRAILVGTGVLLLVLLLPAVLTGIETLAVRAETAGASDQAIGHYLRQRIQVTGGDGDDVLFIVPAATLASPVTRLAADGALAAADRVVALDPVRHLPFLGAPHTESTAQQLFYIVPAGQGDLLVHLRRLYPLATVAPIGDGPGEALATVVAVDTATVASLEGLDMRLLEGEPEDPAAADGLSLEPRPLFFPWESEPPLLPPFTALARGALYAPETGEYRFVVETAPDTRFSLSLDADASRDALLQTEEGRNEAVVQLAQGIYSLGWIYSSGDQGGDLSILWQRPQGPLEPIPAEVLFDVVPENGLLVTYYAGESPEDGDLTAPADLTEVTRRREPILLPGSLAAAAERVVWQAKLAAPVEGEYTFDVEATGDVWLAVDGVVLFSRSSGRRAVSGEPIYLSPGWHDLEIRYRSGGRPPRLALLWQLPGRAQTVVGAAYLLPYLPPTSTSALPLPAPPALSPGESTDGAGPETAAPAPGPVLAGPAPGPLPPLPLEPVWSVGACGQAEDSFNQPRGVALLPLSSEIAVADAGNRRLVVRALADGALLKTVQDAAFEEPFDVGAGPLGEIYLLDAGAQRLLRIEIGSDRVEPLTVQTAFYRPRGIGVDITGTLYVADTGGARVVMVEPANGSVVTQFGGPDTGLGRGQPVDAIALPNGASYAITAEDGVLWRLDTGEGRTATVPANTFDAPHLAALANSTFFATDPEGRRIVFFDSAGEPRAEHGRELFDKPVGIDATIAGGQVLVAVSDSVACTVSVWRMDAADLPQ